MPFDSLASAVGGADNGAAVKAHLVGTHRLVAPEDTLARVKPFLPVMGITRIANVTGLDTVGIPVVMVTRPNSRSVSVSQGKGATLAAAKASGVMESIESYHAERITLPVKYASFEDLRWTHRLVDVDRLPRLSGADFDPLSPMMWIEGTDLFTGAAKWLPFDLVHLNHTVPAPPGNGVFLSTSNGLASGNHRLEAIVHAVTEIVERDAATLWHLLSDAAQERTRIDPGGVDDPLCRSLLARFETAGVAVGVWEITSDVGLPAFLVRIVARGEGCHTVRPATGMGCHAAREIALARALTEAAQSRLTFISGARDDMPRAQYLKHLDPAEMAAWCDRVVSGVVHRRFADVPTHVAPTLEQDLAHHLACLRSAGIEEAVVVDLTKPEFGIPVVRVVVPGLEGLADSPDYLYGARARARLDGVV
jgi:YcaO-like protein with predicted kinase domain